MPSIKKPHAEERPKGASRSTQYNHTACFPPGSAAGRRSGFLGFLGARLCFRLRRRFNRGFADRRLIYEARIAEKTRHPIGRLRPDAEPMPDPLLLERHTVGMTAFQHRVVGAELFDKASVARTARVGDDDRIERPLLGAAA